ncbi:hypothetical protein J2X63_002321 [Agromyces sp. 3263]|uniref:hypothetical protein n=1 Tax=Agromyces sp. 3263 TaxID=2817750 RepID=UPI00285E9FB5|nr:hypothetical protein [Agromyces sp. 3263]MDR6906635.1 hypothetical protein [Agromyces sp. 3263]
MLTRRGSLYVIHAGVAVRYDDGEITLTHADRSIVTSDPDFVEGVLTAAVRQGIRVATKRPVASRNPASGDAAGRPSVPADERPEGNVQPHGGSAWH